MKKIVVIRINKGYTKDYIYTEFEIIENTTDIDTNNLEDILYNNIYDSMNYDIVDTIEDNTLYKRITNLVCASDVVEFYEHCNTLITNSVDNLKEILREIVGDDVEVVITDKE